VNGRDIPVATVTVVAETETVQHVEPLAPNAQAVLRLPQMKGCTATIQAVFEGGEVSVIGTIDVCKVKLVRLIE
jgi:phage-related baseplate assembly protein